MNCDIRGLPFLFRDSAARLIVDDSGKLLWVSQGAAELMSDHPCVSIANGAISGRTKHSERMLREVLEGAAESAAPVEQLIGRAANEVPELFVQARASSGKSGTVFALTVRQLQRDLDRLPDLTRLYGLTPTEQQIIHLMLRGQSITEIAGALNKSVLTVRTHIKRTYLKLNVGTKEQLFSTVMKLMLD